MTSKKIILLITAISLFVGVFFLRPGQVESPGLLNAQAPRHTPQATADSVDEQTAAASEASPKKDMLELQDPAREAKLRIKTIRELKLTPLITPEVTELVALVVSQNPIPSGSDPHSASSYQHQREAAVRVYALRRLSEELSLENFEQVVSEIEQQASDAALVNIAREALKAKQRGGNYFVEMTQGIRSMPLAD